MDRPAISSTLDLSDRVAQLIATGFGAGLVPIAPGTAGSLEAVGVFLILWSLNPSPAGFVSSIAVLVVASYVLGVWASGRLARLMGVEDPRAAVIDEVCGQFIALAPLAFRPGVAGVLVAFLLFRIFDIFKPYPIRRLERLPAGFGVMSDDVLAGAYAAALVIAAQLTGVL